MLRDGYAASSGYPFSCPLPCVAGGMWARCKRHSVVLLFKISTASYIYRIQGQQQLESSALPAQVPKGAKLTSNWSEEAPTKNGAEAFPNTLLWGSFATNLPVPCRCA